MIAGTLEVRGDFIQRSGISSGNKNFYASGSHRVLLSGSGLQRVSFVSPSFESSRFNKLEVTNSSAGGVVFMTPVVVVDELVATTSELHNTWNITLVGTARITGGEWKSDLSFRESSWVLQQDQVIAGDVYLEWSDPLDLNGHTLQVKGNFFHWDGILNINGGKLQVNGDYRVERIEQNGDYGAVHGRLLMKHESDYVEVHGDFVMDSSAWEYEYDQSKVRDLIAGTLEVRGDFTQRSGYSNYGNYNKNFHASGSHRVLLSGADLQRVSFATPSAQNSHFNKLEITNSGVDGVMFTTPAVVVRELAATQSQLQNSRQLSLANTARITGGVWSHDLGFSDQAESWTLQQDQTIAGDLYLESSDVLDVNGHTLQVQGNVRQIAGRLKMSGGHVIIGGNYHLARQNAQDDYLDSYGRLLMKHESDYVEVHGDFVMDSSAWEYEYDQSKVRDLIAGTLEVRGDFTQRSGYSNYGNYNKNFHASGSHRVLLSGAGLQGVSFATPSVQNSHFNKLEITNTSTSGVEFLTPVSVNKLFDHKRNVFTLTDQSNSTFVDYDGDGVKDHKDRYPTDPNKSIDDSDGDGIPDDEDAFPNDPDESVDTDGDGIGNNRDKDDDNDGLPDTWEEQYGFDPLSAADAANDADGDGLTNAEEFAAGSNPLSADSDGDGISDKEELDSGRNPTVDERVVVPIIMDLLLAE